MFERFTHKARRVLVLAQEEARRLGHDYIGTEHLLLGLVAVNDGLAARALADFGVDLGRARAAVDAAAPAKPGDPGNHIPFTPRAKGVLERSLREALAMRHNYIGTEHLLIGLVRDPEHLGTKVLAGLGVSAEAARTSVLRLLADYVGLEPRVEGPEPSGPEAGLRDTRDMTAGLANVLATARDLAPTGPLGTHHVLAAMASSDSTAAGAVLRAGGFDPQRLPGPVEGWDVTGTADEPAEMAAARVTQVEINGSAVSIRIADGDLSSRIAAAIESGALPVEDVQRLLGTVWAQLDRRVPEPPARH